MDAQVPVLGPSATTLGSPAIDELSLVHHSRTELLVHCLKIHDVDLAQGRQLVQRIGDLLQDGRLNGLTDVKGYVQV